MLKSTSATSQVTCACNPFNLGNIANAFFAFSLCSAEIDNAIKISFECNLGFTDPKYSVFKF